MPPVPDTIYEAYVTKNAPYYLPRFANFEDLGGNFKVSWNWSAFFFTFWWFLYRKMYLATLVSLLLGAVPFAVLPVMIASGLAGNFLYYRQANSVLSRLGAAHPGLDVRTRAMALGGVHGWVPVVGAIVTGLILVAVVAAMALGLIGVMTEGHV